MKNKNSKSAAAPAVKNNRSFAARLSAARGRYIGVTTVSNDRVRNLVGQIQNVSAKFATIMDRRSKSPVKFALSTVLSVRGV